MRRLEKDYKEFFEKHFCIDELKQYLQWEGIIGYDEAIIDILLNGKDSIYYDKENMEEL